jgi:galactose-1-phosphate uridylyltransferase
LDPAFAVNRGDETGPIRFHSEQITAIPSGGSLPHPHAQVYIDPHPTTLMRLQREASTAYWSANGRPYWEDLVETEEARGLRFVARVGRTA